MSQPEPAFVVATLWEYIEPLDRGDRYEDPLDEALSEQELGEVCGGGSQLSDTCGIEFVDIEINLTDLEPGLALVRGVLEEQGAPKGSVLRYTRGGEDITVEFGVTECLAVFLDGTGLPDEVYQDSDINVLADQINELLAADEIGEIRASWAGPTETAIFIHGRDAERIFSALQPVFNTYPLCQNARVVIRHGKEELQPRTVRIPLRS
jgi:hypothetical protein